MFAYLIVSIQRNCRCRERNDVRLFVVPRRAYMVCDEGHRCGVQGSGCDCMREGEAWKGKSSASILRKHGRCVNKDVEHSPAVVKSSVRWWVLAADDDEGAQCWYRGFPECGLV